MRGLLRVTVVKSLAAPVARGTGSSSVQFSRALAAAPSAHLDLADVVATEPEKPARVKRPAPVPLQQQISGAVLAPQAQAQAQAPTTLTAPLPEDSEASLYQSLPATMRASLKQMGIETLFPVQTKTLTAARANRDLVVRSKTGSGKTVAYSLPMIEKLLKTPPAAGRQGKPRCMILCPTRELALQIYDAISKMAPSLKTAAVYGGTATWETRNALEKGVDIVVGTPGRVEDMILRGSLDVKSLQVAVLDEADQMLKQGFLENIQDIYSHIPPAGERQTLLFSATIPAEMRQLMNSFLVKPLFIDLIGDDNSKLPETVELVATMVEKHNKVGALVAVLRDYLASSSASSENPVRALVFVKRKTECDDITRALCEHMAAASMHGDMEQKERERVMAGFREGAVQVIVCTDVAARGIDVPETDMVVHFELDTDLESFVHRTGRTGRAGRKVGFFHGTRARAEH